MLGQTEKSVSNSVHEGLQTPVRAPSRFLTLAHAALILSGIGLMILPGLDLAVAEPSPPDAATSGSADAQNPESQKPSPVGIKPLSLEYVPRDAIIVAGIRPSALLECRAIDRHRDFLLKEINLVKELGISFERIEQFVGIIFYEKRGKLTIPTVLHLKHRDDVDALKKAWQFDPEELEFAGCKYLRSKKEAGKAQSYLFNDDRTVVLTETEGDMRRLIIAGRDGAANAKWLHPWRSAADADVLVAGNVAALRAFQFMDSSEGSLSLPPAIAVVREISTALAAVKTQGQIQATVQLTAQNSADASRLNNSLAPILDICRVSLSDDRNDFSRDGGEGAELMLRLLDLTEMLLDSAEIRFSNNNLTVEVSSTMTLELAAKVLGQKASQGETTQSK